MQVVHERCAGLETRPPSSCRGTNPTRGRREHIHPGIKKNVYACILVLENNGKKKQAVRSFGAMTAEFLKLGEWLRESGVTHVAMEATGAFWRRYGPYSKDSSS